MPETRNSKPRPEGYNSINVNLVVKNGEQAIEFYKKAFGAVERYRLMSPDGKMLVHAELRIGDSVLMLNEEMPGSEMKPVETLGGSPVSFYVYVDNADRAFEQAIGAGAKEAMGLENTFWGDRCGAVKDPFGIHWTLATRVEEVSPEQINVRAQEFFKAKAA